MAISKTLYCDVPGCHSQFRIAGPQKSQTEIRKIAADTSSWGAIKAPDGAKLDLCAQCLTNVFGEDDIAPLDDVEG